MTLVQIIVLAMVQGLTEFLPISSSGHLVLAPAFLGWTDQGLAFDVAVHFGTLAGVVGFFRHDLVAIASGWFRQLGGHGASPEASLGWMIIVATLPAGLAGLLLHDWIAENLRVPSVIAATTAAFGILLWLIDRTGRKERAEKDLGLAAALYIGCAQVLALIPGTSRSGITMTAALSLGLTREAAARFSFLVSVPIIVLAAVLETTSLVASGEVVIWGELSLAATLAAVMAYLTISLFLRFVGKIGMAPFAIYRLILALVIVYALV